MQTLRFGSLLISELAVVLAVGWAVVITLILPKGIFHFQELVITTYANGTTDFSTDATVLVRSLGIVSLLTLIFGLTVGAVMGLTASGFEHVKGNTDEYENALAAAGFMKITTTPNGTTYQLTEHGRQFLRDYSFLDRESTTLDNARARYLRPQTNRQVDG